MDYIKVFEYSFSGSKLFHLLPLFLLTVFGFALGFYFKRSLKTFTFHRQFLIFFGYMVGIIPGIMLVLTLFKTPEIHRKEKELKDVLRLKNYYVIEGEVEDFLLSEVAGQTYESFSVQGVFFKYSDYILIDGFHQTSMKGGPINKNGLKVRISYISMDSQNIILKLEMKKLSPNTR